MKTVILSLSLLLAAISASEPQPIQTEKQSVFLFCPNDNYSAISMFAVVNKNDPRIIVSLGLEELSGKNSKANTYDGVLKSQNDPTTSRTTLATLDAKDFKTGKLKMDNNMLSIDISQNGNVTTMNIDARVSSDGHFVVGGPEQSQRDVSLKFDVVTRKWRIIPNTLLTTAGDDVANQCGCLTGICFRAGSTCIDRICAVDDSGKFFVIMDR